MVMRRNATTNTIPGRSSQKQEKCDDNVWCYRNNTYSIWYQREADAKADSEGVVREEEEKQQQQQHETEQQQQQQRLQNKNRKSSSDISGKRSTVVKPLPSLQ